MCDRTYVTTIILSLFVEDLTYNNSESNPSYVDLSSKRKFKKFETETQNTLIIESINL